MSNWISKPETIAKSKKYYAHFDYRTNMGKVTNKVKVSKLVTNAEWVSHHGFFHLFTTKLRSQNTMEKKSSIKVEIFAMLHTWTGVFCSIIVIY